MWLDSFGCHTHFWKIVQILLGHPVHHFSNENNLDGHCGAKCEVPWTFAIQFLANKAESLLQSVSKPWFSVPKRMQSTQLICTLHGSQTFSTKIRMESMKRSWCCSKTRKDYCEFQLLLHIQLLRRVHSVAESKAYLGQIKYQQSTITVRRWVEKLEMSTFYTSLRQWNCWK